MKRLRLGVPLILAGVMALGACAGEDPEGHLKVSLQLPADWESVLDMDALPAGSLTPYIGTVRFVFDGGSSSRTFEFPWDSHTADFDLGRSGFLNVQAITGGQVILEGQVHVPDGTDGEVTVPLVQSGGFSPAGTLLHPRCNHSAVLVDSDLYVLGGTRNTRVIEVLTADGERFASSAWAASLVYPRSGQEVVHDTAGNRLFVFKGSDTVEDNLYEVVDLKGFEVYPRLLDSYRVDFSVVKYVAEAILIGGFNSVIRDAWRIDSSALDYSDKSISEYILPFLRIDSERISPSCEVINDKLLCVGGQETLNYLSEIVLLDLNTMKAVGTTNLPMGKVGHSISQISGQEAVVVGGFGQVGYLKSCEIINVGSLTFTADSKLNVPRAFHTSTLIDTDKLLVIGGGPSTDTSTSAEIIDLTTGESTLLPWRMRVPRAGHTATLLPDGRVLVAGGDTTDRMVEVWNPPSGL
ncbi:MAG: kelch repeat-containing protein [bacterium]|nr:kelch repeat-containing protein [bacterium]